MFGSPMVLGIAPGPIQMSGGSRKKFQMTNITLPNKMYLVKYALKSVPGIADVGDPHGGGDGARTPPRGSRSKKCTHHVDQHEKLKG